MFLKKILLPGVAGLFALLALSVVSTNLSLAAKPGGGGGGSVPSGRIYYHWSSNFDSYGPQEYRGYWSMNADGSGKQLSGYQPGGFAAYYESYKHLSYFTHQGYRWYLESELDALLAVREDGNPNFRTVLLEQTELAGTPWISTCRWSKDDSFISFVARVSGANPEPAKIWVADVAFDELTGLPELTTAPQSVVDGEDNRWTDIVSLDWSPNGMQVAYGIVPRQGSQGTIKIKEFYTGTTRVLAASGYHPAWSPDGLKIAFKPFNEGIHTINPDGSGVQELTNNNWDTNPEWSLDGKFIAFSRGGYYKGSSSLYISDVLRVSATGGSAANLTKDIDGYATSFGW